MRHDATRCVARIPDAADLAALNAALSPPHLPGLTEDEVRSRLQRFPTEQLVLCTLSGDVVGALYTRYVGLGVCMMLDGLQRGGCCRGLYTVCRGCKNSICSLQY